MPGTPPELVIQFKNDTSSLDIYVVTFQEFAFDKDYLYGRFEISGIYPTFEIAYYHTCLMMFGHNHISLPSQEDIEIYAHRGNGYMLNNVEGFYNIKRWSI